MFEELLTNAIPVSIAARLKHGEHRIAETYPDTTVLFADIAGFTPWSSRADPDRVIGVLDDLVRGPAHFPAMDPAVAAESRRVFADEVLPLVRARPVVRD